MHYLQNIGSWRRIWRFTLIANLVEVWRKVTFLGIEYENNNFLVDILPFDTTTCWVKYYRILNIPKLICSSTKISVCAFTYVKSSQLHCLIIWEIKSLSVQEVESDSVEALSASGFINSNDSSTLPTELDDDYSIGDTLLHFTTICDRLITPREQIIETQTCGAYFRLFTLRSSSLFIILFKSERWFYNWHPR